MKNFQAYNPTRIHFGEGAVGELGKAAKSLGKHALLVYGGGSVKKNGSYRETREQLEREGISITEFSGIKPNPRVEDVDLAAETGRNHGVDMVVAVGGGSVIDSAKITAACLAMDIPAWDIMKGRAEKVSALPVLAVLTLAATGTEMNAVAVLQNPETREKIGFRNDSMYPAHSFLDPAYTLSVPRDYTAFGIVDLVAHCLEAWYGGDDASLSDRFVLAIIQEAMEYGPMLMKDLKNTDLRARIMWAATNALNNTTLYGRQSGDWGVHALGHTLSFLYDTPHGATLSIMYPAWIRTVGDRAGDRTGELGRALFGTPDIEQTAEQLTAFFSNMGSPVRCDEAGIAASCRDEVLELMNRNRAGGMNYPLSDADRAKIMEKIW